jgi:hypothetical protein
MKKDRTSRKEREVGLCPSGRARPTLLGQIGLLPETYRTMHLDKRSTFVDKNIL